MDCLKDISESIKVDPYSPISPEHPPYSPITSPLRNNPAPQSNSSCPSKDLSYSSIPSLLRNQVDDSLQSSSSSSSASFSISSDANYQESEELISQSKSESPKNNYRPGPKCSKKPRIIREILDRPGGLLRQLLLVDPKIGIYKGKNRHRLRKALKESSSSASLPEQQSSNEVVVNSQDAYSDKSSMSSLSTNEERIAENSIHNLPDILPPSLDILPTSSRSSPPLPASVARPGDRNAHSNGAAPRRIFKNLPQPNTGASGPNPRQNHKNLGG